MHRVASFSAFEARRGLKKEILPAGGNRRVLARLLLVLTFLGAFCSYLSQDPTQSLSFAVHIAQAEEQPSVTGELIVFAAASLTEPFTEIGKRLEQRNSGLKIVFNFGGSQTLRTQLEQGAYADIFASADAVQMDLARKGDIVQGETPFFVKNRLVVIVPKENQGNVREFRDLAKPGLKLDLANANVPAGRYSRQAFSKASVDYGANFEQEVLRNLVSEEENVKQIVTKVQLGEVDAGVVYVSDVTLKVRTEVLTIPIPAAYNQIAAYPIALTKEVKNPDAAKVFISFLFSTDGQAILQTHGFLPIKN
jgi:molybdate transport system substrate-binding protein